MENEMNKILIVPSILMALSTPLLAEGEITAEMRANAEKAIQSCEQSYKNTKEQRDRFSSIKKPSLFSSATIKKAYKDKEVNTKAFDINFAEFTRFSNEKIGVRTANTVPKLRDAIAAYSSNCSRFSAGISNFVEWAVTGTAREKGFERTYQDWQNEARKK